MMMGPKRPKRSLHMTLNTPWDDAYYLFHPIQEQDNFTSYSQRHELSEEDKKVTDALVKIWVSFAKYNQPKQAMTELPDYGRWTRMEPGHKSLNYFLLSDHPLQRGMRSDFRKAECQFWMGTVPQVRNLSKTIQELEPFPILFWCSVAIVILFALIICTLIVLILWSKHRQGSYGRGDNIYLHHARQL
ncbi:Cholinesterase [Orchesella cincta]|uniref:Cholinesterase n=1 Tax=Orchesella cincta TaxID=48709 RepID=A0A1D2N7D5_ORCCI|nr:Cholinesterase [Orchesella cincta]